jgi:aspartate kinase
VPGARKLDTVSYEEMLELVASGASALQLRSVEFARNHGVRVHVRSVFTEEQGTWIREEDEPMLEKAAISGVTHALDEAVYEVDGVSPAELFEALAKAEITVDTAAQIGSETVFSAPLGDRVATAAVLDRLGATWSERDHLAKISVVGTGLKSHPDIAARTFATLRELRVEPQFVSTSPVKIAFYVPQPEVERVVRTLHEILGLSGKKPESARA